MLGLLISVSILLPADETKITIPAAAAASVAACAKSQPIAVCRTQYHDPIGDLIAKVIK